MRVLKPGDKLIWKPPSETEDWYKPLYEIWKERHGEKVTFVAYATRNDPLVIHDQDINGYPLLRILTRAGEVIFSSAYFVY